MHHSEKTERVVPSDSSAIASLMGAAHDAATVPIGPRWTTTQIEEECQKDGRLVRDSRGAVLAFVLFRELGTAWEISFLLTAPNARGHGRMTKLLQQLCQELPNGKSLWLEVHEANLVARRLYERLGFKEVGQRSNYYADRGAAVLYNYG